jgi:non-heme chloroperoxidase
MSEKCQEATLPLARDRYWGVKKKGRAKGSDLKLQLRISFCRASKACAVLLSSPDLATSHAGCACLPMMRTDVSTFIFGHAWFILLLFVVAFGLTASPPPKMGKLRHIFGFATLNTRRTGSDIPELRRYAARDGEALAYRFYESASERILIFVHGSSYHGAGYHALAAAISGSGCAKVVLPNLRGHFQSGRRRGDVEYVGQLEDDVSDLIGFMRQAGLKGPIILGGHSSGGGFAIRFAGGACGASVSNYLILSPIIPTSPAVRLGNAGGWASFHLRRLYGLLILNAFFIRGFNALPIVEFNKPPEFWDGTETLSYSYRMNASYHPRYRYAADLRALKNRALILVGSDDESVDAEALRVIAETSAPLSRFAVLQKVNHFGIFTEAAALDAMIAWLQEPPAIK